MQKLTYYLEKAQLLLGVIFLVVFVTTTLIQVITRYLAISATWTEEIAVNAFIWSMFSGAAVMVKNKQHFSFNLLSQYLSTKNKAILVLGQNVVIIAFCLLCFMSSREITSAFWHSRWITIPSLKQGYVWLILPITFITMSVYLLEDSVRQIKLLKDKSCRN